ncbi:MAG: hypothetical protein RL414_920 [Actinomycetota bacterium]
MITRFPVVDVAPATYFGGEFVPAKAVPHESLPVSATIFREGHDTFAANVLLFNPQGKLVDTLAMREIWPDSQRYEAWVTPTSYGIWHFAIEVYDDKGVKDVTEKFSIKVETERALIGSWYEFFPRSEGAIRNPDGSITSGNFKTATASLKRVADMGFDVLYIPPIHPIGFSFRKGKNNSTTCEPGDPGVPWGIGAETGGHDSIHPELGNLSDFQNFVSAAKKLNIDVALDLALQCSPDHPWVKTHEDFFTKRPDGTIAYAENPPKKYQDIYPINFDNNYPALFAEVLRVVKYWIAQGIRIFRVDNPHTKPVHFWQELIAAVNTEFPEVVFLAEAFTKPTMMHALGKAGFQQSYTYFTWRVTKQELTDYGREVSKGTSAFFRPNFWVNTPDILPFHLQSGNPAVFALRAVLASTMTPSWGMYAGYELYEHIPLKDGGEEYRDSEKYEIKIRDWDGARKMGLTLEPFIAKLNSIRKEHKALQRLRNLEFHPTDNEQVIAYSKREGKDLILVVVNLDPIHAQEATINWDMWFLGIDAANFQVRDLLDGSKFTWSPRTFVRLNPGRPDGKVAHIVQVSIA